MSDEQDFNQELLSHGAPKPPDGCEYKVGMGFGTVKVHIVNPKASWWERFRGKNVLTTAVRSTSEFVDRDHMEVLVLLAFKASRQLKGPEPKLS